MNYDEIPDLIRSDLIRSGKLEEKKIPPKTPSAIYRTRCRCKQKKNNLMHLNFKSELK